MLVQGLATGADDEGFIRGRGKPGSAGVWVNGTYVGPASRFTVPEKYPAPAGGVEVTLREPRYKEFTTKLTVRPGKTTKFRYRMERLPEPQPPFGRLRLRGGHPESFISVTAGDVSPIYVNGQFYGYVDELNNPGGGLLMPPGEYHVKFDSPTYGSYDSRVTLEANKVTYIEIESR
jgi:hypothetical protein